MLILGRALFQQRGWIPLPPLLIQLVWGAPTQLPWLALCLSLVSLGEGLRLWAASTIGLPSRTRGDEVGPLVQEGLYGVTRNPLYLGNILIWAGLGASSGPVWLGAWLLFMALEVNLMVRWEEHNLEQRLGQPYRAYQEAVPRWWPRRRPTLGALDLHRGLRSERSTLLVLALLLLARAAAAYAAAL